MAEFVPVAERIVDSILAASPGIARSAGDHRQDGVLPDFSTDAVRRQVSALEQAARLLRDCPTGDLNPAERVDHAVLAALVDRIRFDLVETAEHTWNPLLHNPGQLIYALVSRPFAPVEERLEALAQRLAAVPAAMDTARAVLVDCPDIHVETAIDQFTGAADLVRTEVLPLLAERPALRGRVRPVALAATAALDGFAGWLRALSERPDGGRRRPRLGRRLWQARLEHALDTRLSPTEIMAAAWARLESTTERIRDCAAELSGQAATDATVRDVLDRLGDHHPSDESIVELAGRTLAETTDFVRDHDLVSLVDDACEIRVMPEFARGVGVAYCDSPGALEARELPAHYCIAPPPATWPAPRRESFYREYNDHMIRNLTVHEAMPGHYLQLAHARRYRGSTRTRAIAFSGPMVEGWAVHAEEVMTGHGFGGLPVRMQQLKMDLRMTVNALLDQLVHCEDLTEADAMALMTGRGFQEEGEAAGKWRRAQLTSTQLSTYFVGYTEMAAIAAARPAGVPLRRWHDAMLAHGSLPPRHLRTLLGA